MDTVEKSQFVWRPKNTINPSHFLIAFMPSPLNRHTINCFYYTKYVFGHSPSLPVTTFSKAGIQVFTAVISVNFGLPSRVFRCMPGRRFHEKSTPHLSHKCASRLQIVSADRKHRRAEYTYGRPFFPCRAAPHAAPERGLLATFRWQQGLPAPRPPAPCRDTLRQTVKFPAYPCNTCPLLSSGAARATGSTFPASTARKAEEKGNHDAPDVPQGQNVR